MTAGGEQQQGQVQGQCGAEEHQRPTVRAVEVPPGEGGAGGDGASRGFHLTRTRWDPYPWVCGVDAGSAAERAGLRVGDCVLEVNGEDVLGLRVSQVADRVRARPSALALLLWNSGVDPDCDPESLCCGPMPTSLQRLSAAMSAILSGLECPVCLETVAPPAAQCANGHLVCARCRPRADRCPVCRLRPARGRCLLADRVYDALTDAFRLAGEPPERRGAAMRRRLTGTRPPPPTVIQPVAEAKPKVSPPKNKFLSRIMGKSSSVENLSTAPKSKREGGLSVESLTVDARAKSLSSGEISDRRHRLSPAASRSSATFASSRSLRGSLESLAERMLADFDEPEPEPEPDAAAYFCPRSAACAPVPGAIAALRHLRRAHGGPLLQYFAPRFAVDLPPALPDGALLAVAAGGDLCFLQCQPGGGGDLLVWMWTLAGEAGAAALRLVLTLRTNDPDSTELTFKTAVHSLAAVSWDDVVASGRAVAIQRDVVDATFKGEKVKLYVTVTSKASQANGI